VRIRSLAGQPCRVCPGFVGAFSASLPSVKMQEVEPGVFELNLRKGEEVILFQKAGDITPEK